MKKRRAIALVVPATVFAVSLFLFLSRAHEPVYQGKPLSAWLENYLGGDGQMATPENERAADLAVRQIGTNALPLLVEMMGAKDSRLKSKLIELAAKQRWMKIQTIPAGLLRARAIMAFRALGVTAIPAIPDLARLLNDGDIADAVATALSEIGTDAIPVLTNALFHADARVRAEGIRALATFPRTPENSTPQEPYQLSALESATPGIIHLLIDRLRDEDPHVRGRSAEALGFFGKEPAAAVPALLALLEDKDDWPRELAAGALGRFREQAKPALPALLRALNDRNPEVRQAAGDSIWLIDMEAADKAGVKPFKHAK